MIMGVLVGVSALAVAVISRSNDDGGSAFVPVAGAVAVEVVDIVDGDTLHVETVDGQLLTVRLFGVDTPERGEPCFTEATNRLRELAGDRVQLRADTRLQDFAGRELRYVYAANGALIDAILIGEGFAVAWTDDGAFRDELVTIEAQATAAGIGCLWSS
jgi:endonuclease YncB( thermonuclease family)